MSHHLDTPHAAQTGQLYLDDLFVFEGERGTVFVMDVNSSVTKADIKPGFHHEARYEFKIHIDGSEMEALTYRVTFGEFDGTGQDVRVHALTGDDARDDAATGTQVAQGRTGQEVAGEGLRLWAGRITDPFYVDLGLVTAVSGAVAKGAKLDRSAWKPEKATNSFAGTTVDSIVLEVSDDAMLSDGTRIGVWAATKLATDAGGWRQINRAGHPMMWPIFWPTDTDFTHPANTRHPCEDLRSGGEEIAKAVAGVVAANGTAVDPQAYGWSVTRRLFPDVLPYEVGTPANFGFATVNGRTMADNAPEVMFSLVLNTGMTSGLTSDTSRAARSDSFPYVVPVAG
ncbi:DUF4331 family protein [Micromonospora globbae]|jgi:hypothetical protein|uniref:DUF4331 domain-containing protein n=1 Tax=Micromonospora globbae TaxID=1894969 RepID=A0A420F8H4_9ACTN|nr:DUF4331 family protein [Micromonospora globbae]RKF29239.1 DUF4331 domain-containing protein [Micromonospora globbae]WTF84302.1 DUF4331 domain-containing protein [Micromonospora globbae]